MPHKKTHSMTKIKHYITPTNKYLMKELICSCLSVQYDEFAPKLHFQPGTASAVSLIIMLFLFDLGWGLILLDQFDKGFLTFQGGMDKTVGIS